MIPRAPADVWKDMERVWEYPRPPALVPCLRRVRVQLFGELIVDTSSALRVLETSHPPVFYVPLGDCDESVLRTSAATTFCEFKGAANYYDLVVGDRISRDAGWFYAHPAARFAALAHHVAFYATRVGACFVNDERVQAQPGKFACPSVVLRDGATNSGATEIFHPWGDAVAQA